MTLGLGGRKLFSCTFLIKCCNIFSVTSKSAITPSFIGRIAWILPGVRPNIRLASVPTAATLFDNLGYEWPLRKVHLGRLPCHAYKLKCLQYQGLSINH